MSDLDWREFVNALVYCFGCGRFGKGGAKGIPFGWKVLYNPHPEGKPGLHVCGEACAKKVSNALREGPVLMPLEMGVAPPMPQEMRESAISEAITHRVRDRVGTVLDDEDAIENVTEAVAGLLLEKRERKSPFEDLFSARHQREVSALSDYHKAVHGDDDFGTEEENDPTVTEWPKLELVQSDVEAEKRDAEFMEAEKEMHRPKGILEEMIGDRIVEAPEPEENYCPTCKKYLAYDDEFYIKQPELRCLCHGDLYADEDPYEPY